MMRPRLVVELINGTSHNHYQGSDVRQHDGVLTVHDTGSMPGTTYRYPLTNVLRWGVWEVDA